MDIVLLGAPGSGKGTQAEYLQRKLGLVHIASGDLFREHIFRKSKLGRKIESYILRGALVPDKVVIEILRERLLQPDMEKGTILDGFPRTLEQAVALDEMFQSLRRSIDHVIYIEVSDELVIERLANRLICRKCQAPFHKIYRPFVQCPTGECHGEFLYQRPDDQPETVRKRLKTFYKLTLPLINYFDKKGILTRVSGSGPMEEVNKAVLEAVQSKNSGSSAGA
jgi:adenylate kinase